MFVMHQKSLRGCVQYWIQNILARHPVERINQVLITRLTGLGSVLQPPLMEPVSKYSGPLLPVRQRHDDLAQMRRSR